MEETVPLVQAPEEVPGTERRALPFKVPPEALMTSLTGDSPIQGMRMVATSIKALSTVLMPSLMATSIKAPPEVLTWSRVKEPSMKV
jgi:hypothetical protein